MSALEKKITLLSAFYKPKWSSVDRFLQNAILAHADLALVIVLMLSCLLQSVFIF
jgi:hypothetical protein